MKQRPVSMLQIPNYIIRNNKLTALDFALYVYLKHLYYINEKRTVLEVSHMSLMAALAITDLRTIKKAINNLYGCGVITNEVKIPKRGFLKIEIQMSDCVSNFTQLPTSLIKSLPEIGHLGYRLLYFYESFINRTVQGERRSFCFASYKYIVEALNISEPSLAKYNKILAESMLLSITKHQIGFDATYNGKDFIVFDKFNNHYIPILSYMTDNEPPK
jgi:hypothetical protein